MSAPESTTNAATQAGLDPSLKRAFVGVAGAGGLLTLGAMGWFGWRSALGVLVGSSLALGNLYGFLLVGGALIEERSKGWALVGLLKTLALFGLVAWILKHNFASLLSFCAGYGALPIGITLASLFSSPATNSTELTEPGSGNSTSKTLGTPCPNIPASLLTSCSSSRGSGRTPPTSVPW